MEYSLKQQVPYIALFSVLSWIYMYFYPTPQVWFWVIIIVPMMTVCLWSYKYHVKPDASFTITGALRRNGWLALVYALYSCINYYYQTHSCSVLYGLSMLLVGIISVVVLERSIYD